jgi:hypothetical protein
MQIRKRLRRKSAGKNGSYVRTVLEAGNWRLEAGRGRKERVKRSDEDGVKELEIVRMNPLETAVTRTPGKRPHPCTTRKDGPPSAPWRVKHGHF